MYKSSGRSDTIHSFPFSDSKSTTLQTTITMRERERERERGGNKNAIKRRWEKSKAVLFDNL